MPFIWIKLEYFRFFRVFYRYDFHLNRSLMGIKLCNSIMQHKNPIIFHWVVQKYVEKLDENCTDKVYVAVESNYYSHANLLDRSFIQKYHTLTWARVNPEVAVLCSASFSHFSGVTCLATKLWVDLISGKGAAFNKEEKSSGHLSLIPITWRRFFMCASIYCTKKTCFHCCIDLFALFIALVLTIFIVEVERLERKSRANPCYLKNHTEKLW